MPNLYQFLPNLHFFTSGISQSVIICMSGFPFCIYFFPICNALSPNLHFFCHGNRCYSAHYERSINIINFKKEEKPPRRVGGLSHNPKGSDDEKKERGISRNGV